MSKLLTLALIIIGGTPMLMQTGCAAEPSSMRPAFVEQKLFERGKQGDDICQYRIPNLLVSAKGVVFAFAEERVGTVDDHAKNNLVLRRSRDGGQTWGTREVLRHSDNPRVSFRYSSSVADGETRQVFLFFRIVIVLDKKDTGGAIPEIWETEHPDQARELRRKLEPGVTDGLFLLRSADDGETWSEPEALGVALQPVNPVTGVTQWGFPQFTGIQMRNGPHRGRLIVPGRTRTSNKVFDITAYDHNYVAYSDDHGATWHVGGLTQTGTGEACLVELSDGTLYVNSRNESLRCRGYRAWDRSTDGGATFAESGYDLNLPEPHCAASMARYSATPNRILFCNPAVHSDTKFYYDHAARRNLTVRLSEDDCRTWPVGRTVCAGTAGYSALAVTHDGTILCAYETLTDKSYSGTIQLARFNLAWLLDGNRN